MMGLKGHYLAIPSPLDETMLQNELTSAEKQVTPEDYARILAEHKAKAFGMALLEKDESILQKVKEQQQQQQQDESSNKATTNYIILGSDTIVDLEGHILEKPVDKAEAKVMLTRLSGQWHKVHTGVALYGSSNKYQRPLNSFTTTTRVKFANLSEQDIISYIATNEPMDKAGSYGIQGIGGQMVECIEGDFFAVMGLPMHPLSTALGSILNHNNAVTIAK
jgi:MAF protein